jgi:hypothetical protein
LLCLPEQGRSSVNAGDAATVPTSCRNDAVSITEDQMTATTPASSSVARNIELATKLLDRLEAIPAADRTNLSAESFGSADHTSAIMTVADELTTLKNKDREGKVTAFLVDAERRIDAMGLDAQHAGLVKAAARAILIHDLPGCEKPMRQLYAPFESIVPFSSLGA